MGQDRIAAAVPLRTRRGMPVRWLAGIGGTLVSLALFTGCEPQLGRDNPHDPGSTTFVDADADTFGAEDDCNDSNAAIYPGATEQCNEQDDNCDGTSDEGLAASTWFADQDSDGYGDEDAALERCSQPSGYVDNAEDCQDDDPDVHPDQKDLCNEQDDNCDGDTDEDDPPQTFYSDDDDDGFGNPKSPVEACSKPAGTVANNDDCDDRDTNVNPTAAEVCNSEDDNCNDEADEGLYFGPFYEDSDGDSYGDPDTEVSTCAPEASWVDVKGDCDDSSATVFPGAAEVCNGIDDSCNGGVDEGLAVSPYYADQDDDGFGAGEVVGEACAVPDLMSLNNTDCDDGNAAAYPGAEEIPYDTIDQDCDESDLIDVDEDGFPGLAAGGEDCDDLNPDVSPGASEVCNFVDDDCDSFVDEDLATQLYYEDADGDTYGNPEALEKLCKARTGWVTNGEDCDDTNSSINPLGVEVCNLKDDDCDTEIDEGIPTQTWYLDRDGDGFGAPTAALERCAQPEGYVENDQDCNDGLDSVYPDALEAFDLLDNDCDGTVDEEIDLPTALQSSFSVAEGLVVRRLLGAGLLAVDALGLFAQLGSGDLPAGVAYWNREVLGKDVAEPTAYFLPELPYAGFALTVSDFDGDGFSDVAISQLSPSECAVYVFAGSEGGFSGSYAKDQASYVYTGSGSDQCGFALAPVIGALTSSSKALLAVGAPGAGDGAGSVLTFELDPGLPAEAWAQRVIIGEVASARLGASLLAAPDAELWVGAPGDNSGSGTVYRVVLPAEGAAERLSSVTQVQIDAQDPSAVDAPEALSVEGLAYTDLNGDGVQELVVPSATLDLAGAVYVIPSANKRFGTYFLEQSDLEVVAIRGTPPVSGVSGGLRAGLYAVSCGDLDADGDDELLLGALATTLEGTTKAYWPQLHLLMGSSSPQNKTIPAQDVASFGIPTSVSSSVSTHFSGAALDVDADGYPELWFQVRGYPDDSASLLGRVETPYTTSR